MNKYFISPIKQRFLALWVTKTRLENWITGWNFFFILGFGRSGTAFMANLLNQAQGAYVFHEPTFEDFFAHRNAHYSQSSARRYMLGFRKKEIYLRMQNIPSGIYGEVNGNLRCHAQAIRETFSGEPVIHLVRDGRDVIRSHMSRRTMTYKNPFSMSIHPTEMDPWKAKWNEMDRFSRICWYWQEENARLRKAVGKTVQFEKIVSSYDYFYAEILEPCNISVDKENWVSTIGSPRNITEKFQMPKWDGWTPQQKKTFIDICGDEMEECGYSV